MPQDISFDIQHHDTPELTIGATPTVLSKGATQIFTCNFAPTQLGQYRRRIPVEVNGLYTVHVTLKATVVARCVEVADNAHAPVDLGALRVGRSNRCTVELINKAPLPAAVDFAPAAELAASYGVRFEPGTLQLSAKQKGQVHVVFKPVARTAAFKQRVFANVAGVRTNIFVVAGSALGLEVALGASALPFGTVVLGSQSTKVVQLTNSGTLRLCNGDRLPSACCHLALGSNVK